MGDIHDEIAAKLDAQPLNVRKLALRALELAHDNSETAVFEGLKNWVREIVKAGSQS
ncbi:hypothetical protein [Candidatus Cryosericum septentrionale]|jgi:hypothetical protein|uniref:hypothetical protein n=1 Tax=Candidatus Cryosericum septentrionale TaxID=2290913 RepID=UPI001403D027|nr:hypothetical protein [Candidatus Cryosericum septentrionale]